jgi:hypothetical protein
VKRPGKRKFYLAHYLDTSIILGYIVCFVFIQVTGCFRMEDLTEK